jgi:putative ABC transport system permease protein
LGFNKEDAQLLQRTKIISLRVKPGDDASCLNLYRAVRPRLLGVPQSFVERGGFAWADSDGSAENPWKLLEQPAETDADGVPVVPVVLEKNTANYALNLWNGIGQIYEIKDDAGRAIRLRVVGLLGGSIFQGDLLVSEKNLLRLFPEVSGRRMFLVETQPEETAQVAATLRRELGDYGLDVETSGERLARFLAVQNTYLSTFQSLGGLGLLLGTIALAAVQLRAVFERRGELALMRAAGFTRRRVALLVILENGFLLLTGLVCGIMAALVAVLPHILSRTAAVPWTSLAVTLALVLASGLIASLAAVRAAMNTPLLETLREETS